LKLIIAGGRDYSLTEWDKGQLDAIHFEHNVTEVVSGGAKGADAGGEAWAFEWNIPVRRFPADWSLGPKAGPLRNKEMADYGEALAAFPGGPGTTNMVNEATKKGIPVFDFRASSHLTPAEKAAL
jgi:hypothetical protein